ncbi:hypothetical protein GCM10027028_26240 [Streptomyces sundarbansensis]
MPEIRTVRIPSRRIEPHPEKAGNNKAPDEAFPSGAHNVYGYQNCNGKHLSTSSPAVVDHDTPERDGTGAQSRSTMVTLACPPPSHMVWSP